MGASGSQEDGEMSSMNNALNRVRPSRDKKNNALTDLGPAAAFPSTGPTVYGSWRKYEFKFPRWELFVSKISD